MEKIIVGFVFLITSFVILFVEDIDFQSSPNELYRMLFFHMWFFAGIFLIFK